MQKWVALFLFILSSFFIPPAFAMLNLELTHGNSGPIPISVVPFANANQSPQNISTIITDDLNHSGRFKVYDPHALTQVPSLASKVSGNYFRSLGTNNVVIGTVTALGGNQYRVNAILMDVLENNGKVIFSQNYTVTATELRAVAHHISDLIYQQLTGTRGVFSTKIAYIVVDRSQGIAHTHYQLTVADQDGYQPHSLLVSSEPIMSPSWSPNGRQLAYVSFENHRAGIYLQDVFTGERHLLSEFEGINGAPAWSPDGKRLALVLSKTGSPNVYIMDIGSRQLTQITNDFFINTEPAWSTDGHYLLYTSDRTGGPQIYQVDLKSNATTRLSFDGSYNARASYTKDGKFVAMIHRVAGVYSIALLNLDTGNVHVLTGVTANTASPSVAPNGSMILYDTFRNNRNVLGMVTADGRLQLQMPADRGDAQDPAWSPYLS